MPAAPLRVVSGGVGRRAFASVLKKRDAKRGGTREPWVKRLGSVGESAEGAKEPRRETDP